MNTPELISHLNRGITLEYCAVIQYNQYANVLMGPERRLWRDLFKDMSKGALEHAREVGFRVVALGSTPTIEHAPVKQASEITEMLDNALELERSLVQAYTDALAQCEDNPAYRNFLEELTQHEQDEVDEILMYLNKVEKAAAVKPGAKRIGKTA